MKQLYLAPAGTEGKFLGLTDLTMNREDKIVNTPRVWQTPSPKLYQAE